MHARCVTASNKIKIKIVIEIEFVEIYIREIGNLSLRNFLITFEFLGRLKYSAEQLQSGN